jgi:hypothetical protein
MKYRIHSNMNSLWNRYIEVTILMYIIDWFEDEFLTEASGSIRYIINIIIITKEVGIEMICEIIF